MSSTVPLNPQDALEAEWAEWLRPTGPSGKKSQGEAWRRDNPGEWAKLQAYRAGTGPRPALGTNTGRQMVFSTDALFLLETEPPPDTFPPEWADFSDDFDPAPASRWSWWYGGGNTGFPNPGAALVSDGGTGKAVRLTSPVVGGNGQLSSFYDGSGQWGTNGTHQMGQAKIRRAVQNQFIWIWEWHENIGIGINSCAIGLNPNGTTKIQVSGGPAAGHSYTIVNDTQVLDGAWHLYEWDIVWSPTSSGRFKVWLDGRVIIDVSRPTLLTSGGEVDTTVIGGYCYTPPGSSGAQVMDFTDVAVGAV